MQEFCSLLIYFWQVLGEISPFLILIISGCAVYIAFQSKREARAAVQVNLFSQLMARYSSPEMGNALDIIWELFATRRHSKKIFLKVLKKYYDRELNLSVFCADVEGGTRYQFFNHRYEKTNDARRQVLCFFTLSFDLFADFKVLDAFYFKNICSIDNFKFLYHVIEWLELALNPDYDKKTFTKLLEQSGRKDIKDLKEQRPPGTWTEIEQMMEPKHPQSE